ncbi:unnamed protein product [Leptidea sinapis]|uniref:Elongation factor G-like domain-containing protein n=1 Tax=Leptidea sinapis TaxID=189913 RepID=A0A5E4Q5J6_9NEOP|nr:unnamed protein product [Leptidea sinapis]
MELRADPGGLAEGIVIEAELDHKLGKQATVLVQRGTLRKGCVIVAGHGWGKVRLLRSAEGTLVSEAPPSTPVSVLGWRELPSAGDQVLEVESERMRDRQASDEQAIAARSAQHHALYRRELERKRALGRFRVRRAGPREKMLPAGDLGPALNVMWTAQ